MESKYEHQIVKTNNNLPVHLFFHHGATPENILPHWHRSIEINCMIQWPNSEIFVGGQSFFAETGCVWMANSMEPHYLSTLSSDSKRKGMTILFPYNFVSELYPNIGDGYFILNFHELFKEEQWKIYHELFAKLNTLYTFHKSDEPLKTIKIIILILEILQILIQYFFVEGNSHYHSKMSNETIERVNSIVDYVSKYYTSDIYLEDIAKILHLSRGYTAKIIKENLGLTLSEYVGLVRCDHARHDLMTHNGTQSAIALKHGFSGLRTMNRQLKKNYGKTAKELLDNNPSFYHKP